jgi:hypothetical protein
MALDPQALNPIMNLQPDDLLVEFIENTLGMTLFSYIVAIPIVILSWFGAITRAIAAGERASGAVRQAQARMQTHDKSRPALIYLITGLVVIFMVFWLFCVLAVGNLLSLALGVGDESVLGFKISDPLGTVSLLRWDAISGGYVLLALVLLVCARKYHKAYYGTEFLGLVVAAPAVLVGAVSTLGFLFLLVVKFLGSKDDLGHSLLIAAVVAGTSTAYAGLCISAYRLAVTVSVLWFGQIHETDRTFTTPTDDIKQQMARLRSFYRVVKSDSSKRPEKINWRMKGWKVSEVRSSDDRRTYREALYVTTSGRPVHVSDFGVGKIDGHWHKFYIPHSQE